MEWLGHTEYGLLQCHHTLDPVPDPAAFPMHTHTELELLYFISGAVRYCVEGQLYPLQPGDILLMRIGESHSLQIDPSQPYERAVIHFSPELLAGDRWAHLLLPFTDRPLGCMNQYHASELPDAFIRQSMERLFSREPADGEQRILAYLLPVLQEVYDVWQRRTSGDFSQPHQELSAQLVTYINLHLGELDSLNQLEKRFFLSQSQINRIFRRSTGTSVWEYVQIKRLFAAREMLYTGTSPCQAAQACGYREYSTFYRAYKKRFGHAPQQDQRRVQEPEPEKGA